RRRHTRFSRDWSSDVCSSDLEAPAPDPVRNLLTIENDGALTWNGRPIDDRTLAAQLARVRSMAPEPQVQLRPVANASYERSAQVLLIVKESRISNFGFLDNERYR